MAAPAAGDAEPGLEEALEEPEGPQPPPPPPGYSMLSAIGRNAATSKTPLTLDLPPPDYGAHHVHKIPPHAHRQNTSAFGRYAGHAVDIVKIFCGIVFPSLNFLFVNSLLTFSFHFWYSRLTWIVVFTAGAAPALFSLRSAKNHGAFKVYDSAIAAAESKWYRLFFLLFSFAFLFATVTGELNFWWCSHNFYLLESMKTYSGIDPAETDGVRLMDAGKVFFKDGARVATDMGMSYTTWDVYCVAPITTDQGMASQGNVLTTYDLWAVGVNCCRSADSNFHCGAYGDPSARAGLRQLSDNQRGFFRLAVQQAEAAYNIRSAHPIFFYWVHDPKEEESEFFTSAFANWILCNGIHFTANLFAVLLFVFLCNPVIRDQDSLMDLKH